MKESVRLFVGLRPDAAALQAWEGFRLKAPSWPLRWILSESLHVTLKFLGETTTDLQPNIVTVLENVVTKVPMLLGLKGGGVFPDTGSAVFWAGVNGDMEKLTQLAASLDHACLSLGFKAEARPFRPHLTVARLRSDYDAPKKIQWLYQAYREWIAKFASMSFAVNDMLLMKSVLCPAGVRYEVVATIGF